MEKGKWGFRPASSPGKAWNLFKTALQTMVFWLLFLLLIPRLITIAEAHFSLAGFPPLRLLGWCLFALFSGLGIASGYTMSWWGQGTPLPLDCPNELVVKGPYRFVRNPMAIAGIGQGICVGLILGSYAVIVYALLGAFLWHLFVRPVEEADLEERFGAAYRTYRLQTKCWIPRFY